MLTLLPPELLGAVDDFLDAEAQRALRGACRELHATAWAQGKTRLQLPQLMPPAICERLLKMAPAIASVTNPSTEHARVAAPTMLYRDVIYIMAAEFQQPLKIAAIASDIAMRRSGAAGVSMLVGAGGCAAGTANGNGGILTLAPGVTTGTGATRVAIQAPSHNNVTPTATNTMYDRVWVPTRKELSHTSAVVTPIFSVDVPTDNTFGAQIHWTVSARNATNLGVYVNATAIAAINATGTVVASINDSTQFARRDNFSGSINVTSSVTVEGSVLTWNLIPVFSAIVPSDVNVDYVAIFMGECVVTAL